LFSFLFGRRNIRNGRRNRLSKDVFDSISIHYRIRVRDSDVSYEIRVRDYDVS
jgi:hypothetical protein